MEMVRQKYQLDIKSQTQILMIKESQNPIEPTNWPHPTKSGSLKRYLPLYACISLFGID